MTALDRLSAYDYDLPPELIAQEPLADRSAARLLVLDRRSGTLRHQQVRDLPELLQPGDCLVLNDSRVVPARLQGFRTQTGGRWEGLFLGVTVDGGWRVIGQTRGHLRAGESVTIPSPHDPAMALVLKFTGRDDGGVWLMQPEDVHPSRSGSGRRSGTLPNCLRRDARLGRSPHRRAALHA
jgi:S-adenosylmethionine:tRNA ribosyltransferase-isomerase